MMDDGHVFVVHWFMGMVLSRSPTFEITFITIVQKKKKAFIVLYLNDRNYYCLRLF